MHNESLNKSLIYSVLASSLFIATCAQGYQEVTANANIDPDGENYGVDFQGNHTLTVPDGDSIGYSNNNSVIVSGNTGDGTILFPGISTVPKNVGVDAGKQLGKIELSGGSSKVKLQGSNINVNNVEFSGDGTLVLDSANNAVTLTGDVNSSGGTKGTLNFTGANGSKVTGSIGNTGALTLVKAENTATITKDTKATNIEVTASGTLNLQGDATGTVKYLGDGGIVKLSSGKTITGEVDNTSGLDDKGTLTFLGDGAVTNKIGNSKPLETINAGENNTTVNLKGITIAKTINVLKDGTLNLEQNTTGDINFAGFTPANGPGGIVNLSDEKSITGDINNTSGTASKGTLNFLGKGDINGIIGNSNPLLAINTTDGTGKIITLNGDANAANINVKNNDELKLKGNTFANINLTGTGEGKIIVADTKGITGNVTTANPGKGTLTFGDNGAGGANVMDGKIGASGTNLAQVELKGSNTLSPTGHIYANDFKFLGAGTLTVADDKNLGGTVSTIPNNQATLNFAGDSTTAGNIGAVGNANALLAVNAQAKTLTLGHNITAQTTTVDPGATLKVNANGLTIKGNLTNKGTVNLGPNTLNLTGTGIYTQNAGSILSLDVAGGPAPVSGNIDTSLGGNAVVNAGSTVHVANITGDAIPDNKLIPTPIINGVGGAGVDIPNIKFTGNTQTYEFTLRTENYTPGNPTAPGSDLFLFVNRRAFTETVTNPAFIGVAETLEALAPTVSTSAPSLLPLINAIDMLPTAAAVEDALSTLVPGTDGALWAGSRAPIARGLGAVSTRLADRRYGLADSYSSYVAGDRGYDMASWVQVFGGDMDQKERDGLAGYDAYFAGFAVGHEWEVMQDYLTLGLAGSFNYTKVDSKGIGQNELNINSFQGIVYGSYDFYEQFYLDAMASVAYHDYDSIRNIVIPTLTGLPTFLTRAEGDFHGWQFTIRPEVGYQWDYNSFFVIPHAWLHYSHLNLGDYTETGAGGMNLHVDYNDMDELKLAGGLKLGWRYEEGDCIFLPQIHGAVIHDFINDRQASTASFAGGGTSFSTPGFKPDDTSFLLGANLEWWYKDKQNYLNIQYDFEFKNDYHLHGAFLKFQLGW